MKADSPSSPVVDSCPTIRLAQGELASVDMCSCGMLRLNLGAITLRFTAEALSAIAHTLGEALATQNALRTPPRLVARAGIGGAAGPRRPRGQS